MKKFRFTWPKGLEFKLIRFVIIFVWSMGLTFIAISYLTVTQLRKVFSDEALAQATWVDESLKQSVSDSTTSFLIQLITWASDKTDDEFWIVDHDMRSLRNQVEDVFQNPDKYKNIQVSPPKIENGGKFVLQALYPDGEKNADPASVEMIQKLANLGPFMDEIVSGNDDYTYDIYIALPDGVCLAMDNMSDQKFDEDGYLTSYDARIRPWFQESMKAEDFYYSAAMRSALYDFEEVVFGAPVRVDDEVVAIISCGMKLNKLKQQLAERSIGRRGFAILVGQSGQLVCSSRSEGELAMRTDLDEDIRESINPGLREMIERAMSGEVGVDLVEVDGEAFYAAHAPIGFVGWTQIEFVNKAEQSLAAKEVIVEIKKSTVRMIHRLQQDFKKAIIATVIVIVVVTSIAITLVSRLAKKRVAPIQHMTNAVRGFVGDERSFAEKEKQKAGLLKLIDGGKTKDVDGGKSQDADGGKSQDADGGKLQNADGGKLQNADGVHSNGEVSSITTSDLDEDKEFSEKEGEKSSGDEMSFEMEDLYRTGDEIEELATAFAAMSIRMRKYVEDIVQYTTDKERIEAEMDAAKQIQSQMLPKINPHFTGMPGCELFAKMVPAREVGGDMYDFYYLDDDHLAITIGDVSGKGITAALFMALSKQMFKSQMMLTDGDVVAAMNEANKRLCEESADAMFVTVWMGLLTLSTGVLEFVNGGHMYAAVKRNGADFVIEEDNHSLLVGALDFAAYQGNTTTLQKGDIIYLYTDGITEAHNEKDELFGEERMLAALNEVKDLTVEQIDEHVRARVAEFENGEEQYDDMTTLCFKYTGV